jgi:hypothetical protein
MTLKHFLPLFFLILASCNLKPGADWAEIKKTKSVYPADSLVAFKHMLLQDTQTVWLNAAYANYPYKEFCTNNIKVTFDLSQPILLEKLGKDSLDHARMLSEIFKQNGITHFVGQTIYKNNLVVYLYAENDLNALIVLQDYVVPANARIETDAEWKAYGELIK